MSAGLDDRVGDSRPAPPAERALAPDLARGFMLLFIALANFAVAAFATQPGAETAPHGVERWINVFMCLFVNAHAYPVFAVMFGYSIVQLVHRQEVRGRSPREIRSILLRRNAALVVFGFVHAALLNFGDFLGAYGIVGLAITLFLLSRADLVNRFVAVIWTVSAGWLTFLMVQVGTGLVASDRAPAHIPVSSVDSLNATTYLDSIRDRLSEWPIHTLTVIPFIVIVWLGVWAAQRRVLDEPAAHRRLLRWVAVVGLGIGIVGSLPLALVGTGWFDVAPDAVPAFGRLHDAAGMFAGPGYVAVFGLLAMKASAVRRRPATEAVAALGKRSLSGYLSQSVVWVLLFASYGCALGRDGNTAVIAFGSASVTWVASVAVAYWMERRGMQGPAEKLLRRITYGGR